MEIWIASVHEEAEQEIEIAFDLENGGPMSPDPDP